MHNERIILGVDPGLATVGFGVIRIREQGLELIDFGTITTSPDLDFSLRLLTIQRDLEVLMSKHQPTEAFVEELFFSNNTKTAMSVSQARGVIIASMASFGLVPKGVTPNQVKLAVTGDGSADKRQIQDMVRLHFSLRTLPKPDDAADALAIALCGASLHFSPLSLTLSQ